MKERPLLHVDTRAKWREWLAKHHASSSGIWLVSYKKHTGRLRVQYDDAVEEALCYGWIDSLVRRLDDDRAAQLFTPRKLGSGWSPSNVARFAKLVKEGRMTVAGLMHRPTAKTKRKGIDNRSAGDLAKIPPAIGRGLKSCVGAWRNFRAMTPTQRGMYVRWIESAKKAETRDRRLREAIARLEKNEKPGLK